MPKGDGASTSTSRASQRPRRIQTAAPRVAGTIVGTAAYMSPEQARGRSVDRRADIWAFGCVLYETLTGRRPFHGSDVTDVLAAVIRDAPALEALPGDVPVAVRRLLRRCLEKDPARRLDSMRAARLELDEADEPARQELFTRRRSWLLPITIAVLAIPSLVFAGFVLAGGMDRTAAPPVHAELSLAPAASLGPPSVFGRPARPAFMVTSDGTRIVFAGITGGTTQLYVRSLEARQANANARTTGAEAPFLSPDDQWVGFLADGQIRKVPIGGGPVVTIADLKAIDRNTPSPLVAPGTDFYGASWGEDGTIVFGRFRDGLWQVSAADGTATRLTSPGPSTHRLPHHLPDRRGLLLTVVGARRDVAVLPAGATEPHLLIESATDARFVQSSHIVFARDRTLMAVPFDLERLALAGTPFALEDGVMVAYGSGRPARNSGAAQFAISRSGTLVFAPGGLYPAEPSRLVWVARSGHVEPIHTSTRSFTRPRLSPDGRRVAVTLSGEAAGEPGGIYVADLARNALTRLTAAREWGPLWSADGSHVLFMQADGMGRVRLDGSGPVERLHDTLAYPHTVTPDGSAVLFQKPGQGHGSGYLDHVARRGSHCSSAAELTCQ